MATTYNTSPDSTSKATPFAPAIRRPRKRFNISSNNAHDTPAYVLIMRQCLENITPTPTPYDMELILSNNEVIESFKELIKDIISTLKEFNSTP